MASKLLRDTKYVCINSKIPICNIRSELEFKEDIEGCMDSRKGQILLGCT